MTITATEVKNVKNVPEQQASVYKLSENIGFTYLDENTGRAKTGHTDHVFISKIDYDSFLGHAQETYIFPCDETGEVLDWLELDGSMKGNFSHEEVINAAGWSLI